MATWAIQETFHRVTAQPGSMAKKWNREELVRCGAIGTNIRTRANLQGQVHPILADWVEPIPELRKELEQPLLLASKILEAIGLPWLSDFLIDDIFDDGYPGGEPSHNSKPTSAYEKAVVPQSIVRHHRASWVADEQKSEWTDSTRAQMRTELPRLIQWQIDEDIFQEKGWNGYTCRHPRGDLPLSELDQYETIEIFDTICLHERSRNLAILVMAEYPARLAELRRQGKAQSEEYLLTAFMTTVTILHELGHAIYWKDRRSLTRDLQEPFYGADLEMELGDSFIAAIFGGWIPVPVRELSRLRKDFSFADGVAWRQALSWDYHRVRPKYRAHYSIPVDYIARLFTEANWANTDNVAALIRPQLLTENGAALRTVGLHTVLTQIGSHATAAIADFHCNGDGWVWNRRPGALFRIPQYDGYMYPELELPTAPEGVIREPQAKDPRKTATARDGAVGGTSRRTGMEAEVRVRGGGEALATTPIGGIPLRLITTKSEYSPRKFPLVSPTKIPRPVSNGSPSSRFSPKAKPRKRDRTIASPQTRVTCTEDQQQTNKRQKAQEQETRTQTSRSAQSNQQEVNSPPRLGGDKSGSLPSPRRSEISVDELKKRLSRLIGVSLTELERLFDAPRCGSAG
ncbi:hypothetical protein F5Y19DRAFT_295961 [Xylariaceae sp. FL1651]|nr:hypothetical protein F5Y19DRAFT_295961 [Xylariaceae sp. FL1651]